MELLCENGYLAQQSWLLWPGEDEFGSSSGARSVESEAPRWNTSLGDEDSDRIVLSKQCVKNFMIRKVHDHYQVEVPFGEK